MTMMMKPFIVLNQFWMIWHQSRYMGGGFWPLKCVFWNIHLRVQMVWKRTGLFLVCYLIQCLGRCLSTTQYTRTHTHMHIHTQVVSGSRLQILPAASWRPPPEGPVEGGRRWKMLNHNVLWGNKFVFLVLQMTKIAARIAYKVRNWKDKQNPYEEFVL